MPIILEMHNDENLEVRIGISKTIGTYIKFQGIESIGVLHTYLKTLFNDPKWRVRNQALETIVDIVNHFSNYETFAKYLESTYLLFLKDKVSLIRETGISKIKILIRNFKSDWVTKSLLPEILNLLNSKSNYIERTTGLYCLQAIAENSSVDYNKEKILPLILKSVKDPVPNIRFIVCKIFKCLNSNIAKQDHSSIITY